MDYNFISLKWRSPTSLGNPKITIKTNVKVPLMGNSILKVITKQLLELEV